MDMHLFSLFCKVTKRRAQNKETRFFFCRDGVISPSLMAKLQKLLQENDELLIICCIFAK